MLSFSPKIVTKELLLELPDRSRRVLVDRFGLSQKGEQRTLDAIGQEYGITRSFVAPPIVVALAKHPMVDQYDLSSLRQIFSGAAPLSAELALEAGARLGCEVVQGYGMTELSPVSHLTPPGMFKPGSVGVTAPNTLSKIVDPATNTEVGVGESGELCVQGDLTVAKGAGIDGSVQARTTTIAGAVRGPVSGVDRVEICRGGAVAGDVTAPCVVLGEGSELDGRIEIPAPPKP